MLIDLRDIRQDTDYDCGAAAVRAIASHYGCAARPAGLANPVQGMAPDTLAAALRAMGLRVASLQMLGGVADLRHYTRLGFPVACPITSEAGGHWVVVRGVERGRVHVQCPTRGPGSYPVAQWLAGWHDVSAETLQLFDRWGIVAAK